MTVEERTPVVAEVDGVRQQIEGWRQTRTAGRPMPQQLWAAAVKLAQRDGIAPTARALRVDYAQLKRWVAATGPSPARPAATFVELVAPPPAGCRIELAGPRGATMKIDLPLARAELVVDLCQVLWGAAP